MPIKIKPFAYLLVLIPIIILSGCFRQAPVPQPIKSSGTITAKVVKVVIPQPITPDYVPNIKLGIQVDFAEAMNQPSVQTSFGLFLGEYKPSANPKKYEKLELSSICNGTWRVKNKNSFPLSFTWETFKDNSTEKGQGVVAAKSEVFFYTGLRTKKFEKRVRLYVSGKHQDDEDSKDTLCTTQPFGFSWSSDSKTLLVLPTTPLLPNTIYTVVLSTNATNSNNVRLTVPQVFTINTAVLDELPTSFPRRVEFINKFDSFSLEERASIGQDAYDYALANPSLSIDELNEYVINKTLAFPTQSLQTQQLGDLLDKLNSVEKLVYADHPFFAALHGNIALLVQNQRERLFIDESGQNPPGREDAFRHLLWNVLLVRDFRLFSLNDGMADLTVKWITDAHECIYYGDTSESCLDQEISKA